MAEIGFNEAEKAYLVYYDGPTGQVGLDHVCGQGARSGGFDLPGLAVVYLDSCDADQGDSLRPVVAMHELVHVFGAVERAAPNVCQSGHVCDFPLDLMTAVLTGEELEAHVLDSGRNDYYGHSGTWTDVQDSTFLERLDSPDRTPPAAPGGLRVGDDLTGFVRVSWQPSTDDVGPVAYRIYQDGRFVREVTTTTVRLPDTHDLALFAIRAADGGRPPQRARRARASGPGAGMVDEQGRLIRDTVRPPAITRVTIKRTAKVAVLTWPAAHDAGGLRAYRVKIGRADAHRAQADDHAHARPRRRPRLDRGDRPRRQHRPVARRRPRPRALRADMSWGQSLGLSGTAPGRQGFDRFEAWPTSSQHAPPSPSATAASRSSGSTRSSSSGTSRDSPTRCGSCSRTCSATARARTSRPSPAGSRPTSRAARSRSRPPACCSRTSRACRPSSTSPRCGTRWRISAATRSRSTR